MFENLVDIHEKLSALERQLSDPDLLNNRTKYRETVREHSRVSKLSALYRSYTKVGQNLADNRELIHYADNDPELAEMAKEELEELTEQKAELEKKISLML
ncbi:MAG: PCRF domain-containing protein, partial [Candidatus Electrothrix sp. LOE2]|nr:PCRF domain-containing protein [Candidatus Electrothrix sp. LOE2]